MHLITNESLHNKREIEIKIRKEKRRKQKKIYIFIYIDSTLYYTICKYL